MHIGWWLAGWLFLGAAAPEAPQPAIDPPTPAATITAFYAATSVPADGAAIDVARLRALFLPAAHIVRISRDGVRAANRVQALDDFVAETAAYAAKAGFHEHELAHEERRYGDIVQVWSAYEASHGRGEAITRIRGVNSFQLAFDGQRWVIVDLLWENERSAGPVPAALLNEPVR